MGASTCTSESASTSQHSRYGEQFAAIVHDELRRRLTVPAAMLRPRVLRDARLLEEARALLTSASGFAALTDSYAAERGRTTRCTSAPALRFEELEADVWVEVAEGAAEPLLAGQSAPMFSSWRLCGVSSAPHGAGVMVVKATTSGAATTMRLELLELERVLAYAEAEGTRAVCAFLAVLRPDLDAAGELPDFIGENRAAMPRVWALASAGNLGFIRVPVLGAEIFLELRTDIDSLAEQVQRLNIVQAQAAREREQERLQREQERLQLGVLGEQAAEVERARAADRERIEQLFAAVATLQADVADLVSQRANQWGGDGERGAGNV